MRVHTILKLAIQKFENSVKTLALALSTTHAGSQQNAAERVKAALLECSGTQTDTQAVTASTRRVHANHSSSNLRPAIRVSPSKSRAVPCTSRATRRLRRGPPRQHAKFDTEHTYTHSSLRCVRMAHAQCGHATLTQTHRCLRFAPIRNTKTVPMRSNARHGSRSL